MKSNNLKGLFLYFLHIFGLKFGLNRDFVNALCYHSISSSVDKYATSFTQFKKQILRIFSHADFISIKDIKNILGGGRIKKWNVLLTIDDGYQDVIQIIPLLKKLNIPVILFVLSDLSNANREEIANNHQLLTIEEIKKLHKLGWTIGCHSATHADLSSLNNQLLEHEIINSKKSLEKKLGFKVESFAYPKGIFNKKILKMVKKAGYKLAFTIRPGTINSKTNPLLIPRTVITKPKKLDYFPYLFSETALMIEQLLENLGIWKMLAKFK